MGKLTLKLQEMEQQKAEVKRSKPSTESFILYNILVELNLIFLVGDYIFDFDDCFKKGSYGTIIKGCSIINSNNIVACKQICKNNRFRDLLIPEIQILQKLTNNKNILTCYDAVQTEKFIFIITEYCNQETLQDYLDQQQSLTVQQSLKFFKDICEGFKELNQKNIIHRDIKPCNLLLHNGDLKIGDFGFAKLIENDKQPRNYGSVGTPLYMAPQILENKPYDKKCDVWSAGVVLYKMLFGKYPWNADSVPQLIKKIKQTELQFPESQDIPSNLRQLLESMLEIDQNRRYTWEEVFEHSIWDSHKTYENNQTQIVNLQLS